MKRKLLTVLLTLITILCLCFALVGCGGAVGVVDGGTEQDGGSQKPDGGNQGGSGNQGGNQSEGGNQGGGTVPSVKEYTVTFDANGGEFSDGKSTKSVTVEENKKLSVPEKPSRDQYTFVQWCTDSSLSTAWDFDEDVVTKTTTLYAKWEKVAAEYNVTFVLNYAGAQDVVKSTENGLVTYIPTRDGYVFNGWWLNDGQTQSGEYILSQKWDPSETVTAEGLVLVAEWVEKSTVSSQLPAPSVGIEGDVFSWSAVPGAVSYEVRVYKSGSQVEETRDVVDGTRWTFPSDCEAGYYTVKIRAMGDGETTVNSSYVSKSYGHLILSAVSNISFDMSTSVMTWTAVRNATSYILYVNGIEAETLTRTTYDFSDYEAGTYTVKIVAARSGYQSSTASTTIEKLRLKTPNVTVTPDENGIIYTVSWESVLHADTYIVTLNGEEHRVTDATSYTFDCTAESWGDVEKIVVTVAAFDSNTDYLRSNVSEEQTVQRAYSVILTVSDENAGSVAFEGKTGTVLLGGAGEEVTFTAIAATNKGYTFVGWYQGEEEITTELSYHFTMMKENLSLEARWTLVPGMELFSFTSTPETCVIHEVLNKSLTDITVPDCVTSIEQSAFKGCTSLASLTIPFVGANKDETGYKNFGYIFGTSYYLNNAQYVPASLKTVTVTEGVTTIGNYAFDGCNSIETIAIPASVTSIGNYAFADCSGLTSVTFGDNNNLKSIGDYAFLRCSSLESVIFGDGSDLTSIGNYAFLYCSALNNLVFPANVNSIGNKAFRGCSSLASIDLPDGVASIGEYTFAECSALNDIAIPAGVTSIGDYAFSGCCSITRVSFGDMSHLTSIGKYAFSACSLLNGIVIPAGVASIEAFTFQDCVGLKNVTIENGVTKIGYRAFYNCTSLTNITIPNSVTTIGSYGFEGCTSLESLTIPFVGANRDGTGSYSFLGYIFGVLDDYNNGYYVPASLKTVTVTEGVTTIGNYAFDGCNSIENIAIPASVTSIGNYAFRNCSGLTSIEIPISVTSIGGGAFSGCSGLTSLEIPNGVTSLGGSVFWECSSLESIKIPESVPSIGDYAFRSCSSLESVIFGNKSVLTSIGTYAFEDCILLNDIVIPAGVTSIGNYAFVGCSSLENITVEEMNQTYSSRDGILYNKAKTEIVCIPKAIIGPVEIPKSIASIPNQAFGDCNALTGITVETDNPVYHSYENCVIETESNTLIVGCKNSKIPTDGSVTSIGSYAFYGCKSLQSIEIPESVTSIGSYAFYNCSSLTSIVIPHDMSQIGWDAFDGCYKLVEIWNNSSLQINVGKDTNGKVAYYAQKVYRQQEESNQILTEDGFVFYEDTLYSDSILIAYRGDQTDLTLPALSPTGKKYYIYRYAFYMNDTLTSVTIPECVTSIGNWAFGYCTSLTDVKCAVNSQLTSIGYYAFYNCSSLKNITVPDSVSTIEAYTFYNCSSLTSIAIPDGVTEIRDYAFYNCSSLKNITIPDKVYSIRKSAFEECSSLTSVQFASNSKLRSIETSAFEKCVSLKNITLPDKVTSIGNAAFASCNSLENITIPSGVTSIGTSAFYHCSLLTRIKIPNGVTSIAYGTFQGCTSLISIEIPESVTTIGDYAFSGCTSLANVVIPEGVTSIGERAFNECQALTSITISNSVSSIGSSAFYNCRLLTDIQFKGTVKGWQTIQKDLRWDDYMYEYSITCTDGKIAKDGSVTYF